MTTQADDIVITGIGVILPNCDDVATLWLQLKEGRTQLTIEPDPADPSKNVVVGRVRDFDPARYLDDVPERFYRQYHREVQMYLASVYNARRDAGFPEADAAPERIGLYDGCSRPMFAAMYERIQRETQSSPNEAYSRTDLMHSTPGQAAGIAASLLEIRGSVYTFNGTCSAGGIALGHAFRELKAGLVDVAFATGHEASLVAPLFAMYRHGRLLSQQLDDPGQAIRPYADCLGNAFGEGAITLTLERRDRAEARGATCYAKLSSYHYGNNGFHPTSPDLAGGRPARLIREALSDAGCSLDDVGFVVGHGNGVALSDASEHNYMLLVFGDRGTEVPLVSNKPIYGHTLGASSTLNVAAAALMLQHQYVIPTLSADGPAEPHAAPTFNHMVTGGAPIACRAGLTVSFGLGGNNAVLLLERYVDSLNRCSPQETP